MKNLLSLSSAQLGELGVSDWGYTDELRAGSFDRFKDWLKKGDHGPLGYLADHRADTREELPLYYPQAQSALCFLFSYFPERQAINQQTIDSELKIASYVFAFGGGDYHYEMRSRLVAIGDELKLNHPGLEYVLTLDVHPVLERDLVHRSGLGWFGKNSMLISREEGSFFLIGSLILNQKLALESGKIETDHCGQCTACIDACPTNAIDVEARTIIASRCISTFTIETPKEQSPPAGMEKAKGEIFGCDICQDVCPWNIRLEKRALMRSPRALTEHGQKIVDFFLKKSARDILRELGEFSVRGFMRTFEASPLSRPGKRGLMKNVALWVQKSRDL
jgi:epoxyqueuosine reductase